MSACEKKNLETVKEAMELLNYWVKTRGSAVQIDGSVTYTSNRNGWITFPFMGRKYKLNGDTKDYAVVRALKKYQEIRNSKDLFLIEGGMLRITGDKEPDGWYCYSTK